MYLSYITCDEVNKNSPSKIGLITPSNIGKILKPGTVSESAYPEDSKTVTIRKI